MPCFGGSADFIGWPQQRHVGEPQGSAAMTQDRKSLFECSMRFGHLCVSRKFYSPVLLATCGHGGVHLTDCTPTNRDCPKQSARSRVEANSKETVAGMGAAARGCRVGIRQVRYAIKWQALLSLIEFLSSCILDAILAHRVRIVRWRCLVSRTVGRRRYRIV